MISEFNAFLTCSITPISLVMIPNPGRSLWNWRRLSLFWVNQNPDRNMMQNANCSPWGFLVMDSEWNIPSRTRILAQLLSKHIKRKCEGGFFPISLLTIAREGDIPTGGKRWEILIEPYACARTLHPIQDHVVRLNFTQIFPCKNKARLQASSAPHQ